MGTIQEVIKYSKKLKLLYVEDNDAAREATLVIFKEFFDNIVIAVDGQDAIEKLDDSIDLIITDINMPHLNGLEMTKIIRDKNREIPILVLSAYNESGFFIDSIKLGVDGYLLKPIDIKQFLSSLEKIVNKLKLSDEADSYLNLLRQYQEVTDKSVIISKTDLNGIITYVNDAFCEISEYSSDELIGQNHNIVRHPNNSSSAYQELWDTIQNKKSIWQGTIRNRSKSGKDFYVILTIKPMLDKDGEILEYIAIRNNITDVMNQKKQLIDLSNSMDDATIVLIKIEEFDDIEKFYGHELSQKIEEKFATEFVKFLPENLIYEKFFTLGDGEYALVQNKKNASESQEETKEYLTLVQQKVNDARLDLGDVDYDISIIISVACGTNAYENARYGLKQILKNNQDFIIANDLLQDEKKEAQKNLSTIKMIKKALEESKIICYFQPIINNQTKEIAKYETLVRLVNSDNEILTPYHFLDVAKRSKYYSQITWVVLEQAFYALEKTDKDITINISATDIEKGVTRKIIFNLLTTHSENAHRIIFELLEDENIKDFQIIKEFITKVKSFGAKIAIDDFGTGYSNFERLLDYQPDILKIDGSIIKNIITDPYALNVLETIVNFAKKQNIETVGEFVENEAIYNKLKSMNIDYSQGYFFGKPDILG